MAAMAPSPEQVQEVYSLFVKDNDNSLATKDLGTALRALGMDMSEAQLQDAVGKLDAEGSDTIDYRLCYVPVGGDERFGGRRLRREGGAARQKD